MRVIPPLPATPPMTPPAMPPATTPPELPPATIILLPFVGVTASWKNGCKIAEDKFAFGKRFANVELLKEPLSDAAYDG